MRAFFQVGFALGKSHGHDGFVQVGAPAHADYAPVEPGRSALGDGPKFIRERTVNHTEEGDV